MAKIYAVKKGLVPGIYKTWDECKNNVEGFPGAVYKSFKTEAEANEYLGCVSTTSVPTVSPEAAESPVDVVAYVDGSYNKDNQKYAFGMVIILGEQVLKFTDVGRNKEAASMRNVAGEILGAEKAMLFAINNGYHHVKIYYDYEGIEKWCTGEWSTGNPFTKEYKEHYLAYANKIKISFEKVAAHTGDTYNEIADELAKSLIF